MIISTVVRVVAIACAGVLAGIYFGYGAGPQYALQALRASSFVQFQQVVHVHYVTFMPILVVVALLAAVVWLVMIRSQRRSPEFWLIALSAGGIALIAVMTRAVSVPLNNQLMTWSRPAHAMGALGARQHRARVSRGGRARSAGGRLEPAERLMAIG